MLSHLIGGRRFRSLPLVQNLPGAPLDSIKDGKRVRRRKWKNLTAVFLVPGSTFNVNRAPLLEIFSEGTEINYHAHIDGIGADGFMGIWVPSMVIYWQTIEQKSNKSFRPKFSGNVIKVHNRYTTI
jgi:hypothetical protein